MERVAAARMPAADHPASPRAAAGAHPAAADRPPLDELARLRKRVHQQERSLVVMAEAISVLRDGSRALREENRELRLELQATQRSSATTDRAKLRAIDGTFGGMTRDSSSIRRDQVAHDDAHPAASSG